jgi:hypothetical protein
VIGAAAAAAAGKNKSTVAVAAEFRRPTGIRKGTLYTERPQV